jgi:hypothetical protein
MYRHACQRVDNPAWNELVMVGRFQNGLKCHPLSKGSTANNLVLELLRRNKEPERYEFLFEAEFSRYGKPHAHGPVARFDMIERETGNSTTFYAF